MDVNAATGRDAAVGLSYYGKVIDGLIALIVTQNIGKVVGTLLIEGDDAAVDASTEQGQPHAWLTERLHVPLASATPMTVIAP